MDFCERHGEFNMINKNLPRSIGSAILALVIVSMIGCGANTPSSALNDNVQHVPLVNKPEEVKTAIASSPLESWVGEYEFSEYAPPNQNMFYQISIYKEGKSYYAKIDIDGFQTMERLQAQVEGDGKAIKIIFDKYLPDNLWEPYQPGDILLRLEKTDSALNTFWEKIQPMLKDQGESGKTYFEAAARSS
ncbi:DUF5991 domain-containing protein [Paenibacillus sp. MZ04-78.2]|uniref:DUF5991 domain-containing protein n=1 Tax=Paenibacillus sp. MZ04-78.2 TaxID=2962034 RepID=UPI0020B65F7B|nr:DUF5991 domain-containing protein [Paenibacillus sp. MZ04-78.2]MCP3772181.1 DUF5991 domain-containing protein [Paenibacillus sp. MZ04-78.2]